MSNREIIRIENLVKTYHMGDVDVHALNGVNLAIEEGSYVAIMGASGSGKSFIAARTIPFLSTANTARKTRGMPGRAV